MAAVPACGWMMMFGLAASPVPIVEEQPVPVGTSDPAPTRELLLYLAEFEDADGQWVDPVTVADDPPGGPGNARPAGQDQPEADGRREEDR